MSDFDRSKSYAQQLDKEDPLGGFRDRFLFPKQEDGSLYRYFCGNSLGLQPVTAQAALEVELEDWANLGVEGHFKGRNPWYDYHERFAELLMPVVGAKYPHEVVAMNGLTANLHFLLVSFYRPTKERYKIVIEDNAFPSDRYAVASQARTHGLDPEKAVVALKPRDSEHTLRTEDIVSYLKEEGHTVATVMLGGINYYTGQFYDLEKITEAAHEAGAMCGFDLAHAAGNVLMELHDWQVDFACWCSYKYLNSGPGSVGGAFVHDNHRNKPDMPRFEGWWGTEPQSRFKMEGFELQDGAPGWQLSNAPVLAMAVHYEALKIWNEAGRVNLRQKSEKMTAYLEDLLLGIENAPFEIITPKDKARRGSQLSLKFKDDAKHVNEAMMAEGLITDFRAPDVIRVAPVPLYNSYEDVWIFVDIVKRAFEK